jgi:dihydroorotate dehydrogenase electron transfer subunit
MLYKVLENRHISGKDYLLKVEVDAELALSVKPGQFAMLQVREGSQFDPLLRRPLGIFDVEGNTVSFLYRVYGRGTRLLTKVKDAVSILMPLGNFLEDTADSYLFVAGGIGIGGLFYAAKSFAKAGKRVKLLYGDKSKEDLSAMEFVERAKLDCTYHTEDGSFGTRGTVVKELENYPEHRWIACGPVPMLKEVVRMAEELGTECLVSMDARMACGVGACLSCVVKTKSGYRRCCVEGPLFKAEELLL